MEAGSVVVTNRTGNGGDVVQYGSTPMGGSSDIKNSPRDVKDSQIS